MYIGSTNKGKAVRDFYWEDRGKNTEKVLLSNRDIEVFLNRIFEDIKEIKILM